VVTNGGQRWLVLPGAVPIRRTNPGCTPIHTSRGPRQNRLLWAAADRHQCGCRQARNRQALFCEEGDRFAVTFGNGSHGGLPGTGGLRQQSGRGRRAALIVAAFLAGTAARVRRDRWSGCPGASIWRCSLRASLMRRLSGNMIRGADDSDLDAGQYGDRSGDPRGRFWCPAGILLHGTRHGSVRVMICRIHVGDPRYC